MLPMVNDAGLRLNKNPTSFHCVKPISMPDLLAAD
jgi:hypothetical protein